MKENTVLFVTHKPKQCGVYQFGQSVFGAISPSSRFHFVKAECGSLGELQESVRTHRPVAIIYNYHPSVLPWACTRIAKGTYRNNLSDIKAIQIGIIHEVTQPIADSATGYRNRWIIGPSARKLNCLFDHYIAADPTLLLKNLLVYKTGRLVPAYTGERAAPTIPIFGSFGFATAKKGFEKIVTRVQNEFDEAVIRLNMPSADFGDKDGSKARRVADNCKSLIQKPGIRLEVTHDFLEDAALLDFLAGNSMNVFLYEDTGGRGISSALDNALAVRRPIAVSNCPMFRHVLALRPSVCVDENSLAGILKNGFAPLEKVTRDWSSENLLWDYERILKAVLHTAAHLKRQKRGIIGTIRFYLNKLFSLPDATFTWLRNTESANDDDMTPVVSAYTPISPGDSPLNCILDDVARARYQPAAKKLFELVPITMAKKIERANVQQAFVFDTVYRLMNNFTAPKMLCVGSYEDTASMGLRKMGYEVEEIDPMVNYSLQEFYTKPTTKKGSYDLIFSTSVIEHDPDDESFMKCIEGLLSPRGYAVITCDYKDGWKKGDSKPGVDARLYTKDDLEKRLPSYMPSCRLVDIPNWDCPNPDFNYQGAYQYTFATFVVQKIT